MSKCGQVECWQKKYILFNGDIKMKIAFVSCSSIKSKLQHKQPIWGIIQQQRPNLLLLLGDNVYISKEGYSPIPQLGETSIEAKKRILAEKYEAQVNESHFKALHRDIPYLLYGSIMILVCPGINLSK
ncbi:MAG TPA: hypothetical protein VJ184_10625 [Chryseolinea sp.]|nr:hypothetical protein [Chryseolinea sp.]